MKTRKVSKLISNLTRQERKNFLEWLAFELGTTDHRIYVFATNIKRTSTPEQVWKTTFPDRPFDDPDFRKLGTLLQEFLEEFMAIKVFRKDENLRYTYMLKFLTPRADDNLYIKEVNKSKARLDREAYRDAKYYQAVFEQQSLQMQFLYLNNQPEGQTALHPEMLESYNLYHLHHWAEMAIFFESNAMGLGIETRPEAFMTSTFMENLPESVDFATSPTLPILLDIYRLNKGTFKDVEGLLARFRQSHRLFSPYTAANLVHSILNPCLYRYNHHRDENWLRTGVEVMEFGIDEEYLLQRGDLHPNLLRAMVLAKIHLNEIDQARGTLSRYKTLLSEQHAEDYYMFLLAACAFASDNYAEALDIYRDYKFADPELRMDARVFTLFAYYGQENEEFLPPLIEQRIAQVTTHESSSEPMRERRVKLLEKLRSLVNATTVEDLDALETYVRENCAVDRYEWMLRQIDHRRQSIAGKSVSQPMGRKLATWLFA